MKEIKLTIFFKFIMGFIFFTILLFIINLIYFRDKNQPKEKKYQEYEEKEIIEYKANQTIRVKFHDTGEVVAMDVNDYLRGVVPSEMSPRYDIEALKAQALVARTYLYQKMSEYAEGEEADICDDPNHCQAYLKKEQLISAWEAKGYSEQIIYENFYKVNEAVVSTQDEVIQYENQLIKAFFHASSPDRTEDISQIWGGESLPYLLSVENQEDENYENRYSEVTVSFDEFSQKIMENYGVSEIKLEDFLSCNIYEKTTSGRVKNIKVGNTIISAEKLRTIFGLKSTNFTLEIKDNCIIFHVVGYGHGVGMSQVGANYYASQGFSYVDIIKHYYTNVEVVKLTKERRIKMKIKLNMPKKNKIKEYRVQTNTQEAKVVSESDNVLKLEISEKKKRAGAAQKNETKVIKVDELFHNLFRNKNKLSKKYYVLLIAMFGLAIFSTVLAVNTYQESNLENFFTYQLNDTAVTASSSVDTSEIGNEAVLKEEQEKVVVKQNIVVEPKLEFTAPMEGDILKLYSIDKVIYSKTLESWKTHDGVDIKGTIGQNVKSIEKGKVDKIYEDSFLGYTVVIDHSQGYKSSYSNLGENIPVKEGQIVSKGQILGQISNSSIGEIKDEPHLHFMLYKDNQVIDPTYILNK